MNCNYLFILLIDSLLYTTPQTKPPTVLRIPTTRRCFMQVQVVLPFTCNMIHINNKLIYYNDGNNNNNSDVASAPTSSLSNISTATAAASTTTELCFNLLTTIDFSSKRKRMSVVISDTETNDIILYCKGKK